MYRKGRSTSFKCIELKVIEGFHIEMFRGTGKCKIKAECETWAGNCIFERALLRVDGCQREGIEREEMEVEV